MEICETETFKASCPNNQVIVMTSALYGRMHISRCVKKSLGYVGCKADVLPQLDRRCSGLSECQIRMPDPELDRTAPCLEELKTYLEASYDCTEGNEYSNLRCAIQTPTFDSPLFYAPLLSSL
jgi:hypothetical protein